MAQHSIGEWTARLGVRLALCLALALAALAGVAGPAWACDIPPDPSFRLSSDDLIDLDDPDGPLARSYAQWLAETDLPDPEAAPPTVVGVTLREIVGVVAETDNMSVGTVTASVGVWGEPLPTETVTREPIELGSIHAGSCDGYPSGDLGDQHLVVDTDRGAETLRVDDATLAALDAAFGPMTPVETDQREIDTLVTALIPVSPLTVPLALAAALGALIAFGAALRRLILG